VLAQRDLPLDSSSTATTTSTTALSIMSIHSSIYGSDRIYYILLSNGILYATGANDVMLIDSVQFTAINDKFVRVHPIELRTKSKSAKLVTGSKYTIALLDNRLYSWGLNVRCDFFCVFITINLFFKNTNLYVFLFSID